MRKLLLVGVGAVMVVIGLVWMLQGLNVLGGSAMSGKTMWAIIGPIVAVVGLGVAATGLRRSRTPDGHSEA